MNSQEITAAKMICKSIDALTREVYMLRRDLNDKEKLDKMIEDLDKEYDQIPCPLDREK